MKKLDGTITLSILDEDNIQRIIFRIIPLCTREGMIFRDRAVSYPDFGSLRIIPDKREQSSFKERMHEIGNLCCVQLVNDGKELTKIRQNRNYDPNQDECNQYAIYSDVICGFEEDAIFEVYQDGEDYADALTDFVLLQRGKVLYGPVKKKEEIQADALKPFGNENYLMHTVEDMQGNDRTYYWNPEAIVTWRQRKKGQKRSANQKVNPEQEENIVHEDEKKPEEIPIGTKLDILNVDLTHDEHITELNAPVSGGANRLKQSDTPILPEPPQNPPKFQGTPIAETPRTGNYIDRTNGTVHGVVEKQITQKQSNSDTERTDRRLVENPLQNLRMAFQEVWKIPTLHQELLNILANNAEMTKAVVESQLFQAHTKSTFSAAKAELDAIEGERISLLVELDKVKDNYQQIKEKMYSELAKQKKDEIDTLDKHIAELNSQKSALEETLAEISEKVQSGTMGLLGKKLSMDIASNGSDLTISPVIGTYAETSVIIETIRKIMGRSGFMCKQDCVMEFMVFFSLYDEICILAPSLQEAEVYIRNILRALGLLNFAAWPSVFGTLRIVSLLPDNDLRTPTVEIIKNNRTPVKAYGHKTIRLIDQDHIKEAGTLPIIHTPKFNINRGQEDLNEMGKPVSLRSIQAFSDKADPLYKAGEEWFDKLENKLTAVLPELQKSAFHSMRVFARVAAPQLIGGFMEAADAAVLAWIVPALMPKRYPQDELADLIGDLPMCMQILREENR